MTTGPAENDEPADNPANLEIRRLNHALVDQDFTQWINVYGPDENDKLFLLFWVGHGFAYPDDARERLALLGSNADDFRLRHVELNNLLWAASGVAPEANVVAFVNACRAPVTRGWEQKLKAGFQEISTEKGREADRIGKRFVVYAAAHGKTTKMAGEENTTFADALLRRLEDLPPGDKPLELFDEKLEGFVKDLSQHQAGPHWTTYGYWDSNGEREWPPPPDDQDLAWDEWQELVEIATAIDGAHDTDLTGQVRGGAYYHAVDLNGREDTPPRLRSVIDLVTALRDRRPLGDQAPPLVIACDYVAHLPGPVRRQELITWCDRWAAARGGDGVQRLRLVRDKRPARLPDRPYLSIFVDDYPGPSPGRYHLKPVLSAIGEPCRRPSRGPVSESQIPAQIAAVINDVVADGIVPRLDSLLVELVLPRRLVLRGWRPEYMKPEPPLGIQYAIVIRDLEVARGRDGNGAVARARAWQKYQLMTKFVPDERSRWSERIEWFTCEDSLEPTPSEIASALQDPKKFCIGLGRKRGPASSRSKRSGSPMGLVDSIKSGAPIVISMQHANGCHNCVLALSQASSGNERTCEVLTGKSHVNQKVDDNPDGLHNLPYILREIRNDFGPGSELQVGVYMEFPGRLWAENLKSQYRPVNHEISKRAH